MAFLKASSLWKVKLYDKEYEPEDIGPIGELLLETTRILVKEFSLSWEIVWNELPKIDVLKTAISTVCPRFASPVKCTPGKYRRIDGLCNNLKYPTWGATRSVFSRLIPPAYFDGISAPRESILHPNGKLPNPRVLSSYIHRDEGFHDHAISLLFLAWGQFMDHDFTLTASPLDPDTRNENEHCCGYHGRQKNPYCMEITVPADDKFYKYFKQNCMDFVRAFTGVRQDCRLGVRAQFNILTGLIDVNTVYGGTEHHASELREGYGGLLKMNDVFKSLGLRELLPAKKHIPEEGCTRETSNLYCFDAGEIRVNEQLILTTMHTLWFRQHNLIAKRLGKINPHWSDETLYQGFWNKYNPHVDPSMTVAFITAAFRFGHSLLPSAVERWTPHHEFIGSKRLSSLIRHPYDLYRAGVIDEYYSGLLNQPVQAMDDSITQEVTNHLFKKPGDKFGVDLVAFNIQRGREFGLPGYNAFRKYCGLSSIKSVNDLVYVMTNLTAHRYGDIYSHIDDIDLWSAGVSERPLLGSLLGPTFSCIVAIQMHRIRHGDSNPRVSCDSLSLPHLNFGLWADSNLSSSSMSAVVVPYSPIASLLSTNSLYALVLDK